MILTEIKIETVFSTAVFQDEKSNYCRGPPGSQRSPEGVSILGKEQP